VHCATPGIRARPGAAKYTQFGTPLHHGKIKQKEKTYYFLPTLCMKKKCVDTLESLYKL
jgi:hypothetical protein